MASVSDCGISALTHALAPCRKGAGQLDLPRMDRSRIQSLRRCECGSAAGRQSRQSDGYCRYGAVPLF